MRVLRRLIVVGLMTTATCAYAGNGDLIVDGKVGVGTASPQGSLHINSIDTNSNALILDGPTNYKGIKFNVSGAYKGQIIQESTGNIYIDSAKDLLLRPTGKVGIGTINPSASLTLDSNFGANAKVRLFYIGTSYPGIFADIFHNGDASGLTLQSRGSTYGSGDISFWTGSTTPSEIMRIKYNGNVGIGTTSPAYTLDVAGTIRANNVSPSDIRFKENIVPVEAALDKVLNIQSVVFNWKRAEYKEMNFPEGRHYGVIAQEIEKVLPEVVNIGSDGTKAVAYTEIIPVLIEAIKEQQKEIEELKKRLSELR